MREPGSLPDPRAPAGTDQVPEIENFIVVMMENHSFDNMLGMLGRGDGFPLGPNGEPTVALPRRPRQPRPAPSTCRASARPTGSGQNWNLAHHS